MSLDVENIKSNWETFEKLLSRLDNDNLNLIVEMLGDRIVECPASTRLDQYGAYPGGLVEHTLEVVKCMRKISEACDLDVSIDQILKVGLVHDLGKIGDIEHRLFLDQDSTWHQEKLGQMYKFNEEIQKMSVSHRTLWLLQTFGVVLTNEEWLAIQVAQGSHFEENRYYVGSEPTLALLLQQAKVMTISKAKK